MMSLVTCDDIPKPLAQCYIFL